jgi:ParB-like chromosome segregation protein Spo0J
MTHTPLEIAAMAWKSISKSSEELIDEPRVEHYRKMIRSGKPLPAVLVREQVNGRFSIIDGVQRVEACHREGIDDIYCCVVKGRVSDYQVRKLRRELHPFDCQLN